jgi:hypothetical protein
MTDYNIRLMEAVIKNTKNTILLGALLQGKMYVKFYKGLTGGPYVGNGMMRTEKGLIDLDPASITGIVYEDVPVIIDGQVRINILKEEIIDLKNQLKKSQDALRLDSKAATSEFDDLT